MKKLIVLLTVAAALIGCAETSISTSVSPEYYRNSYSHVAVYAYGLSDEYKQELEQDICAELIIKGAKCTPIDTIIPADMALTKSAKLALLLAGGYDSVLHIILGDNDHPSLMLEPSKSDSEPNDNWSVKHEIRLFDIKTQEIAALLKADTSSEDMDVEVYSESLSKEVVNQLARNRLISAQIH